MKICPKCSQTYGDDSLNYCLMDRSILEWMLDAVPIADAQTIAMYASDVTDPNAVSDMNNKGHATKTSVAHYGAIKPTKKSRTWAWVLVISGGLAILFGVGLLGLLALPYGYNFSNQATGPKGPSPTPVAIPSHSTIMASEDDYDLSMAKYNQISTNMARSEVEEILGGKGTEMSSSIGGGVRFTVNKWEGENFKSIILSFRNDKIMSKSQVGLK